MLTPSLVKAKCQCKNLLMCFVSGTISRKAASVSALASDVLSTYEYKYIKYTGIIYVSIYGRNTFRKVMPIQVRTVLVLYSYSYGPPVRRYLLNRSLACPLAAGASRRRAWPAVLEENLLYLQVSWQIRKPSTT